MVKGEYKTINGAVEDIVFKEKGSRFIGYAFQIKSVEASRFILERIRNAHKQARHVCYAYKIYNGDQQIERYSDDGEPNYSAGLPIFQQIKSFDLNNVIVIVVRYFGGVKLGVGGLIRAYKTCAEETLSLGEKVSCKLKLQYKLVLPYEEAHFLYRAIAQLKVTIVNQNKAAKLEVIIEVEKAKSSFFLEKIKSIKGLNFSVKC